MVDEKEEGKEAGKEDGKEEETAYLGNWKTKDDAEKGLSSLQNKIELFDRQAAELGASRTQINSLMEMLNSANTKDQDTEKARVPDVEEVLTGVMAELGKVDLVEDDAAQKLAELFGKGLRATAKTVEDKILDVAGKQFQDTLSKRDADALRAKFLEKNPRFTEMQKAGAFQAYRSQNPLHDDFSAYFEAIAQESNNKVSELQAELEKAKKIANLAGGDERTGKIFTKPGNVRTTNNKPKTQAEKRQSATEAVLNASRSG